MRGVYVHIGANKGMGCPCPLYSDGTFKFIPIKEDFPSPQSWTYEELGLKEVVPDDWKYAHYDPEFRSFTWGDHINKRTYLTRQLDKLNYVFFVATLQKVESKSRPNWIDPDWSYCIIGYFVLESPIPYVTDIRYPISKEIQQQFPNNAHIRRDFKALKDYYGENLKNKDKRFCIFKGTNKSKLLDVAIPISDKNTPNELAKATMKNLNENAPRWWANSIIDDEAVNRILDAIKEN